MATFFFQAGPVRNADDARRSDTALFGKFFHHLLERGVYFPPSQYEALFVSAAHSAADIDHTVRAIREFSIQ
jgi:glutamate-1-semialdehyde 2,1-aminomutase